MFFHKNNQSNLVFFVFGFIALGIIVSVAFFILSLFSHSNSPKEEFETVQIMSPAELTEQYIFHVKKISEEVTTHSEITETLLFVEDALLGIRVPAEYQQKHLEAVLAIARLRSDVSQKSIDEVKNSVIEILKGLEN